MLFDDMQILTSRFEEENNINYFTLTVLQNTSLQRRVLEIIDAVGNTQLSNLHSSDPPLFRDVFWK
ncbi:hypothetical protein CLV32_4078 [Pedobacter duraquae]|uniref:Uncharacterized protein n=1 Tax=Pedobacter duraquae TaxID=425511 RepID=A0A4R6IF61_9SPHI|nr:hypothetical protein CLV32_4078 [Pedobacter duraquae]